MKSFLICFPDFFFFVCFFLFILQKYLEKLHYLKIFGKVYLFLALSFSKMKKAHLPYPCSSMKHNNLFLRRYYFHQKVQNNTLHLHKTPCCKGCIPWSLCLF